MLHDPVEVTSESGKGAAVDHQNALGGGSAGGTRGRGTCAGGSLLVLPQQMNLLIRQAELGVGNGIGLS